MERLTERDLRALLTFVRDAYAQSDVDAYARYVVSRLTDIVPGHRVSYNEAHPRRGTLRALIRPKDDIPPLTARHYRDHPMMQRFVATGDGRAYKFSDFLTADQLHATAMYQDHYRPAGVEHQVTVCLGSPTPHVVAFAVGRDRRDFNERDRTALNLLRSHLATAFDRACATERLARHMTVLGDAADAAAAAVVLLDRRGRMDFTTRLARQWLREFFPRRGRPSAHLPDEIDRWLEGSVRVDDVRERPPAPLVVAVHDRRLTIRVIDDVNGRALLLEATQPPDAGALRALGLTPREADVLALLADGATNEAIARRTGAAPRTVAKHVERIHRKLGVETRAAAAARAHALWHRAAHVD